MAAAQRVATRPLTWGLLAVAFFAVHSALAWANTADLGTVGIRTQPAGDVTGAYRFWVDYWHATGRLVGIDTPWVYPIGALPPMLLAAVLGTGATLPVWLGMVTLLDAGAVVLLALRRAALAWWWLAFTVLLGPIALVRIDAVALPFAIAGVLVLGRRPWVGSVLLTIAAWVKVWPAAILVAMVVALRRTAGTVAAAALTSAVIIVAAMLAGARGTVFSFITAQAARGLQIEAPVALPWLWSAALGDPAAAVYFDTRLLTFQVRGVGVDQVAALMTPVLLLGVLAVAGSALLARRRGIGEGTVLAVAAFGFVAALIALNKVGSPQYLTWYAAPVILGLVSAPALFRGIAVAVLVTAVLTQAIYPWCYDAVIATEPLAIALLTARNMLQLGLLGWALVVLARLRPPPRLRTGAIPAVQRQVAG